MGHRTPVRLRQARSSLYDRLHTLETQLQTDNEATMHLPRSICFTPVGSEKNYMQCKAQSNSLDTRRHGFPNCRRTAPFAEGWPAAWQRSWFGHRVGIGAWASAPASPVKTDGSSHCRQTTIIAKGQPVIRPQCISATISGVHKHGIPSTWCTAPFGAGPQCATYVQVSSTE